MTSDKMDMFNNPNGNNPNDNNPNDNNPNDNNPNDNNPNDNENGAEESSSNPQTPEDMAGPGSLVDKVKALQNRSADSDSHVNSRERQNGTPICQSSRCEVDAREKTTFEAYKEKYCALKDKTANWPYIKRGDHSPMTCVFTTQFDKNNIVYHMYQYESCLFYMERAGKSFKVNTDANCECFTDFTLPNENMGGYPYDYDEQAFVSDTGIYFMNCVSVQQCLCEVYNCQVKDENENVLTNEKDDYCEGYMNVKKRLSCKPAAGHERNKTINCKFMEDPLPFETQIVCPRIRSLMSTETFKGVSTDPFTVSACTISTNELILVISFIAVILFYLWGMMRKRVHQRMNRSE